MKKHFLSLGIILFSLTTYAQIYVDLDASGSNDGTSWANAYNDLESAINNAVEGNEIWISEGTYLAPSTATSLNTFFLIDKNIGIFGGFNGTETSLNERNVEMHQVIIDADQNGDDVPGEGQTNRLDNNRHIMWLTADIDNTTVIDGITFKGGTTEPDTGSGDDRRGGAILSYGAPMINNCTFTENYGYFGGGFYPRGVDANGVVVTNCDFIDNYGGFGAGLYSLAEGVFEDLHFEGNGGTERGLGMFINNRNNTIQNCTFIDNSSFGSSGGALQLRSNGTDSITVNVINCEFRNNSATFGGAVASYDSLSSMIFEDCIFRNNMCENVGGASSNAFGASSTFINCLFDSNMSNGNGGAHYSQNDDAIINIYNCQYLNNTAEFGGVLSMNSDEEGDRQPLLTIDRADMFVNSAIVQAGAINLVNTDANISNILVTNNITNGGTGVGGAMSINASDSVQVSTSIVNSTFADNFADLIAGISNWEGGPEAVSTVFLQNVILSNPLGDNYGIEDGEPLLISNGGNLSTDESTLSYLTNTNDFNNEEIEFVVGPGDFEFYPDENSAAINNGIVDGSPLTDLNGNERIGLPDIGALENQSVTNTSDYLLSKTEIAINPNPITNQQINLWASSPHIGEIELMIIDSKGVVIYKQNLFKATEDQEIVINNLQLNQGVYFVQITDPIASSTKSFISLK